MLTDKAELPCSGDELQHSGTRALQTDRAEQQFSGEVPTNGTDQAEQLHRGDEALLCDRAEQQSSGAEQQSSGDAPTHEGADRAELYGSGEATMQGDQAEQHCSGDELCSCVQASRLGERADERDKTEQKSDAALC